MQAASPRTLIHKGGLVLQEQPWRFGNVEGLAWLVHVDASAALSITPSTQVVMLDKLTPDDRGPWAMINGGFYERAPDDTYRAMGVVVSQKRAASPYRVRGGSGVLTVKDDRIALIHRSAWSKLKAHERPDEALQSIDRLVSEGRSLVKRKDGARAAARSAVALTTSGPVLVVLAAMASVSKREHEVILRGTSYNGLPLWAFAEYLADHVGAQEALNLDGAVSTQLAARVGDQRFVVRGERGTINGVLLRPSGGAKAAPAARPTPTPRD